MKVNRSFVVSTLLLFVFAGCTPHFSLAEESSVVVVRGHGVHSNEVRFATFSPDGKNIVLVSVDAIPRIVDATSGKELQKFVGHYGSVKSVHFAPDGQKIVSACTDNIRIWDVETGVELRRLESVQGERRSTFNHASFSPDSKKIVAADSSTVQIWDVESGKLLRQMSGHALVPNWTVAHSSRRISSTFFSPDGRTVVSSGTQDRTIRTWNAYTGKELQIMTGHEDYSIAFATFSPDGKRIASAGGEFHIWDALTGRELLGQEAYVGRTRCVSFSPDGKKLIVAGDGVAATVTGLDGLAISFGIAQKPDPIFVRIFDSESGTELQNIVGHTKRVWTAFFSPDGTKVVTASDDGTARIVNVQ